MDHFAGLDVSVKETSVCIVDDTAETIEGKKGRPVPMDHLHLSIQIHRSACRQRSRRIYQGWAPIGLQIVGRQRDDATVLPRGGRLRGRSAVEGQVATHAGADGVIVE